MRPHENLDVWRKAADFSVGIYNVTEKFPRYEGFGLPSQIRRALVSVSANIAEGAGRKSIREFLNFLSIAQGPASEAETEFLISHRLGYCSQEDFQQIMSRSCELGRIITGLSDPSVSKTNRKITLRTKRK